MDSDAISRLELSQARAMSRSSSRHSACGPWEWWTGGDEKERGHKLCDRVFAQLLSLLNFSARVVCILTLTSPFCTRASPTMFSSLIAPPLSPPEVLAEAQSALEELTEASLDAILKALEQARDSDPASLGKDAQFDSTVTGLVKTLVGSTGPTPGPEIQPTMIRCVGIAAAIALRQLQEIARLPAPAAAMPDPAPSIPADDAKNGSAETCIAKHPILSWLGLLVDATNPAARLWSLAFSGEPGTMTVSATGAVDSTQSPKALKNLANQLIEDGCLQTILDIIAHRHTVSSTVTLSTSSDKSSAPGPSIVYTVEAIEGALTFCSQLVSEAPKAVDGASASLPVISSDSALASAICRAVCLAIDSLPLKRLRQPEALRIAVATQQIQLLMPSGVAHAASLGFKAFIPARAAVASKALLSPVLTLRLWAVKDLSSLVGQATALTGETDGTYSASAVCALSQALVANQVPQRLLGDLAHEEVLSRAGPIFLVLLAHGSIDDATLKCAAHMLLPCPLLPSFSRVPGSTCMPCNPCFFLIPMSWLPCSRS